MGLVAFDTHAYVKRLTGAGMPEAQAEVLATEQTRLIENELATKRDIAELKQDIKELEATTKRDIAELKRDLKDLEYRLTIRLGLMLAVAVGLLATLDKLL